MQVDVLPEIPLKLVPAPSPERIPSVVSSASLSPAEDTSYARSALEEESHKAGSTPEGNRHLVLNSLAFRAGQLIAAGLFTRASAQDYIRQAASQSGFPDGADLQNLLTKSIADGESKGRARDFEKASEIMAERRKPQPPVVTQTWRGFTLTDAYAHHAPPEYLLDGIFELPSLNIVYGASGSLKSFLLQDLMACVVGGIPWLPPAPWGSKSLPIATLKAPALWVDYDNGRRRTHQRFGALGKHYQLSPEAPLTYFSMPQPWLDASSAESTDMFINVVKQAGAKLIVVDNLGRVSGNADENSADMSRVMGGFRMLAEETNSAVVVIHHERKSNGIKTRAGEGLRGHSSIEASLDLALLVEREGSADTVVIRSTKTRGQDVLPFSAAFTYENAYSDAGAITLASAAFYGLLAEDLDSDYAIERLIKEELAGKEMAKKELRDAVKNSLPEVGVNRISNRIEKMAAFGAIKMRPGPRTEKRYCL